MNKKMVENSKNGNGVVLASESQKAPFWSGGKLENVSTFSNCGKAPSWKKQLHQLMIAPGKSAITRTTNECLHSLKE